MSNTTRRTASAVGFAAAFLCLSSFSASAKYVSFQDGFENANQQGWTTVGEVVLQAKQAGNPQGEPHTGKAFLAMRQTTPGPGLSLTNTILVNAPRGNACSLQIWLRPLAKTGSLSLVVKDGFAAGSTLAARTISPGAIKGARRDNGYAPYRLNFKHTGNLMFVSLDGFGPIFVALDDVNITCRAP